MNTDYALMRKELELYATNMRALGEPKADEIAARTGGGRSTVYRTLKALRMYYGASLSARTFRAIVDHGPIRDLNALAAVMDRHNGEAPHEIAHGVWDLQKKNYVKFRERKTPDGSLLVDIRAQPSIEALFGHKAADVRYPRPKAEPFVVSAEDQGVIDRVRDAQKVMWEHIEAAEPKEEEPVAIADPPLAPAPLDIAEDRTDEQLAADGDTRGPGLDPTPPMVKLPWVPGNMGGWPLLRAIRDRNRKASRLAEAARILEEVGEDDAALALMGKIEFSDLEQEVNELLQALGEE